MSRRAETMALVIGDAITESFSAWASAFVRLDRPPAPDEWPAIVRDFSLGTRQKVEARLIKELGGVRLTIPSRREAERQARHYCIFRDFTGCNHKELAERHGYGLSQVYKILKKRQLEFQF